MPIIKATDFNAIALGPHLFATELVIETYLPKPRVKWVKLFSPKIGEAIVIDDDYKGESWWESLIH